MKFKTSVIRAYLLVLFFVSGCAGFGVRPAQNYEARFEARPIDRSKPNIIVILTDDQPADTMDFMPVLQRELVGKGVNFVNGFVTTPLCCPSRASILTGQYAHNHEVLKNKAPNGGASELDDSSTMAVWLQDAGYTTSFIGKYLNEYAFMEPYGYIPPGWDDWQVLIKGPPPSRYYLDYTLNENGDLVHYSDKPSNYGTDTLSLKAIEFIYETADQPFFLFLSFFTPHQPRKPADRHEQLFRTGEEISARRPPNYNEEDVSDKPEWVQTLGFADDHTMDVNYQRALRSLISVDEAIEDMLTALEATGQRENTVIIYLSDNGELWGEHRIPLEKDCPYEECIRVPFVVSYPGLTDAPREDQRMVLNIDLAPTIAEIAGAEIPTGFPVDGDSFLSLLEDQGADWRSQFLIEHWRGNEAFSSTIPDFSGIRTAEWKYVMYETGEMELYDLINDPYEMENLADLDEYQEIMNDLAQQLEQLLRGE